MRVRRLKLAYKLLRSISSWQKRVLSLVCQNQTWRISNAHDVEEGLCALPHKYRASAAQVFCILADCTITAPKLQHSQER